MRVFQPIISHQDSIVYTLLKLLRSIFLHAPEEVVSSEFEDEGVGRLFEDAIVNAHLLQCCS
jgi:hypothetical protein